MALPDERITRHWAAWVLWALLMVALLAAATAAWSRSTRGTPLRASFWLMGSGHERLQLFCVMRR